ncbi:MAG: AbrB/MazE/SpoVT family DNA-binding domain-containing protein [Candidatus Anammoxibacter sp.]
MSITMTSKNQITIPKKIVNALDLNKGAMFDIKITGHRIELVPVEVVEKVFTDVEYARLDEFVKKQKGKEKKVTQKFIDNLK